MVRSSRPEVFCKKGVLRNFTKFTGKHLWQSPFFNKVAGLRLRLTLRPATLLKRRLWHRCFSVNFVKFLRTPFFIKHLWWLLLHGHRLLSTWIKFVGIYPSNFDVSYTAQKTQFHNWVLKLNLHFVCFCFCLVTRLLELICNSDFRNRIKRYLHVSYMQLFDYLCIHNITYRTYLDIQKMKT